MLAVLGHRDVFVGDPEPSWTKKRPKSERKGDLESGRAPEATEVCEAPNLPTPYSLNSLLLDSI